MNERTLEVLLILMILLIVSSLLTTSVLFVTRSSPEKIKVACVGDSLTQSSSYPYYLWMRLGLGNYSLRNFGAGSTTISLNTQTPYMNTSKFKEALDFQPNIVIMMLGTNDAQPRLEGNNATLTSDYVKLITAFRELPNKPEIWLVLPPPIISNQTNAIDAKYFSQTVIPCIQQAAKQTGAKTIDVYSTLLGYPEMIQDDGLHVTIGGAEVIAQMVSRALNGQSGAGFISGYLRA
jgi:acyl-CoA thioesterase I